MAKASSQTPLLKKCLGLHTAPNRYNVPEGALVKATNILIRRDGVIEPMWGCDQYATSLSTGSVDNWHKAAEYSGKLFLAGRRTDGASYSIAMADLPLTSISVQQTGEDPPDLSSNFTSSTQLPFYDLEFLNTNGNLYYNAFNGLKRIGDTTGSSIRRAGNYPCTIALMPRPLKTSLSRSGTTTVTATTAVAHGYAVGTVVVMSSAGDANFGAGTFTIVTVPSNTKFTYVDATATTTATLANQTFSAAQFVGSSGILTTNEQVAYRAHLVEYDPNGTEYVNEVSGRVEIIDASPFVGNGANKNVQLAILFPAGSLAANVKFKLYRTKKGTSTPGDEMFKVYERFLTSLEVANGVAWVQDSCPDAVTGEALYTNETQEGFSRNNLRPGCAKTVALWNSKIVMANTTDPASVEMQLLGTTNIPAFKLSGNETNSTFDYYVFPTASGTSFTGGGQFTYYTGGTASTDTKNTVLSLIDCINWGANTTRVSPLATYMASFSSVAGDWPGRFVISRVTPDQYEATSSTATLRTVHVDNDITATSGDRDVFTPRLGAVATPIGAAIYSRSSNSVTIGGLTVPQPFKVGEYVKVYTGATGYISQTQLSIAGTAVEGRITDVSLAGNSITISNAGSNGSSASVNIQVATQYMPTYNSNRRPNQLRVSKRRQPEAFPAFSTVDVGQPQSKILKCAQCGQSLIVFKEDGLFRVTEDADGVLRAELLDPTAVLWAKDSVQPINDKVMAWLTKGVAIIGDQGVEKYVSEPVYDKFKPQTLQSLPFSRRAFAVVDEINGLYELRMCLATNPSVPYASDTNLTYCIFNDTWVEDDLLITSEIVYKGLRYLVIGTALWAQYANSYYRGTDVAAQFSGAANEISANFGSVDVVSGNIPPKGSVLVGNDTGLILQVTAVSGSTLTIFKNGADMADVTIDTGWTVYKPIPCDIQWPPITLVEENKLKMFKELHVLFGLAENYFAEIKTSTELEPTAESTYAVWAVRSSTTASTVNVSDPGTLRIIVPQQHRRAQQLNIELLMYTACPATSGYQGVWTITGLGVMADVSSTRVNR